MKNLSIGNGYDIHRLVEGRRCVLGGVEIPSPKGLLGHSDALLGAAGLPDIGPYRERMKSVLAKSMGIAETRIGLKATTNKGVDEIGKGQAIAACLLSQS